MGATPSIKEYKMRIKVEFAGTVYKVKEVSFLLALLFRTCGVLLCIHYIFLRTDCIILKNIACS